jgi:hypothetical protein
LPALLPIPGGQARSIHFIASNGVWRWTEAPYDNSINGVTVAGDTPTLGQVATYNAAGQIE